MGIILWVKSYSIVLVLCKSRPIWHPYLLVQVLFWHTFTAAPSCIINLLSRHERKVRSRPSERVGPGGPSLLIIDQWRYSVEVLESIRDLEIIPGSLWPLVCASPNLNIFHWAWFVGYRTASNPNVNFSSDLSKVEAKWMI